MSSVSLVGSRSRSGGPAPGRAARGAGARALLALVALALVSCAGEREPIDRTQPNALPKAFFEGEWYFQQTVVDIPAALLGSFVGETNFLGMERVRWDIQEDWLYARRSFERIKEGEANVAADGTTPDGKPYLGEIVAAYRIETHFDIKRAYNPTTGEEYNVLEENTSDRPWYLREYIRVDWSTNHATNFEFLADDVRQDPIAYYVQDPNDPDAPQVDFGEFDDAGKMTRPPYLDVTNVTMMRPGMTYIPELGESYPTCWFFDRETADCVTSPIKIRNSFLRLDPNRQYVPRKFKGDVSDHFGVFTQERLVWDPQQGVNQRNRESYAQLHNLWKNWLDDAGNVLPPSAREVRPMVYYAHGWPAELQTTLRSVEEKWNAIFQRAVAGARGQASYDGVVFKICNVPVPAEEAGDLCGAEGFAPRIGDIRYSSVVYVPAYYDGFRLLGFGPSNTDPITGEVVSGAAYLYVWNEHVTQRTIEDLQLLNGDMDPTTYIDGVDLTPWQDQAQKDLRARRTVSPDQKKAYVERMDFDWTAKAGVQATPEQLASLNGLPMREALKTLAPGLHQAGGFNGDLDDSDGRLAQLRGTYLEDLLLNEEVKLISGIAPQSDYASLTSEMLRTSSVARLGPVKVMDAIKRHREKLVHTRGLDLMNTADDGYIGLAEKFKGMTQEEMRPIIRDAVFHAVLAHELGHTFTLHHNMGATEDVVNYHPKYWELRSADGSVDPRWNDPLTDAEIDGEIYKYAYSSIMDYSRLTLDYGPGRYDSAAILLAYANKVEAWVDSAGMSPTLINEWANSDGTILQFYFPQPKAFHYTEWWKRMGPKFYDEANRMIVDADGIDWGTGFTASGLQRVPYVFCSPFSTDIGSSCFTRDYGADEYERVTHHIQNAKTWYITRAFTRYRVGASPENYVAGTYGRTYRRLKGYNDFYALIVGILRAYGFPDDSPQGGLNDFLTDDAEGWASYTIAEADALNFLLETIATPDIGSFQLQVDPAGRELYGYSAFGTSIETNVVTGRYFTTAWNDTSYDDDCGMYFYQCLHHYGFYLDKIMALEALTDANTYFVGRDTAEDVRHWRISYYDNYKTVLNDFLGSILAQDYDRYAPYYVESTKTFNKHDFAAGQAPTVGKPLDPATGFSVQLYAAVLGMARLQNNFDKSFLDSTRMWYAGSGFEVNNAKGSVEFTDPIGGKTYRAINDPTYAAARMIDRAQKVLARSSYCTDTCATVTPAEQAKADGDLQLYTQLLDVMVDLTGYYETYTQGYNDPYNPGQVPN